MKTITKWLIIGFLELILSIWLLDTAADFVSAKSDNKVKIGVAYYLISLVVIPSFSLGYVTRKIINTNYRKNELKKAFPDEDFSLLKLLDKKP